MLVVEPEKRLTMSQISKHRWLSNCPPVDTGPDITQTTEELNQTVIEHMLQLPGVQEDMIINVTTPNIKN